MRLRFGWTDENLAVIPRNKALASCGNNKTGLVTWRAAVTQKFDVFCFNETGGRQSLHSFSTELLEFSVYLISRVQMLQHK